MSNILNADDAVQYIRSRLQRHFYSGNDMDDLDVAEAIAITEIWKRIDQIADQIEKIGDRIDHLVETKKHENGDGIIESIIDDVIHDWKKIATAIAAIFSYVTVSVISNLRGWHIEPNILIGIVVILLLVLLHLRSRL